MGGAYADWESASGSRRLVRARRERVAGDRTDHDGERSRDRQGQHGRRRPRRDCRTHQRSRGARSRCPRVTNATGDYVFPNVTPDTYTVEVTMDRFKTCAPDRRLVSGGDRVAVGALAIEVGGASETVNVTAEAPLIQAPSGERRSRHDRRRSRTCRSPAATSPASRSSRPASPARRRGSAAAARTTS